MLVIDCWLCMLICLVGCVACWLCRDCAVVTCNGGYGCLHDYFGLCCALCLVMFV